MTSHELIQCSKEGIRNLPAFVRFRYLTSPFPHFPSIYFLNYSMHIVKTKTLKVYLKGLN